MNSWLRKRVPVFTGTLYLWDIDGRIQKINTIKKAREDYKSKIAIVLERVACKSRGKKVLVCSEKRLKACSEQYSSTVKIDFSVANTAKRNLYIGFCHQGKTI